MNDIQVPQRTPPPLQFQGAPTELINALYNRPKPGEIAANSLNQGVSTLIDDYYKGQQLKAQAFGEGGPYLMSMLYGNGQRTQPPSPQVGASGPTNAPTTPDASAQTQPPSQAQGQPNGIPETIQSSLNMGHPDFAGHLSKIRDLQGRMGQSQQTYGASTYGLKDQQGLQKQLDAEKMAMDAEQAPMGYAEKEASLKASNAKFATPEQGAAVASGDPRAIANAYAGPSSGGPTAPLEAYQYAGSKALEKNKAVASEVSKQGEDTTRIGQLRGLFNDLKTAANSIKDPGLLSSLKGDIANRTGGKYGDASSADLKNVSAPMTAALNYELTKRFNESEADFLMKSMMPSPMDQSDFRQKKLARLDRMISALESGNDANIKNVASTIASGAIPKMGNASAPNSQASGAPDGRITVVSPTGQVGHIPASQLKQALAKGYKQQ